MPLSLFVQLELTGFLESTHLEPGLLLQIHWKDVGFPLVEYTGPDMIPAVEDESLYSSLHRIPYDSLSGLPPSELDISRSFSAAEFSTPCSLYLAPKIAAFVSDLASSFAGRISPPSLLIFAKLKTLLASFASPLPYLSYPAPELLIPRRQGPFPQPQGRPLRSRLFYQDYLVYDLTEAGGSEVRDSSERNRSSVSGVSVEAISKLKTPKLVREDNEAGDCSVCLQKMSAMKELVAMPCDHIFHEQCILSWLEKQESCPLCRFQL